MAQSLPFVSLNAATGAGAGESHDLEGVYANHLLDVETTGFSGSGGINVFLETSLDGINWYQLNNRNVTGNGTVQLEGGAVWPARYVRANIPSWPGGVSAAVTATVASC